ncbi:hypothetical protein RAS1_18470 [Phycisphaerae bacterium RAS1]|nr:hypothetical protein RAS1_18470 [Phycisphaerae bacterium RAS1]
MRHLRLIALFARVSLQNEAAYRFDFFLKLGVAVAQLVGELFSLWVIFSNTRSVAGWSAAEVVVLLGVFRMMVGIIGAFVAPNMRRIMEDIRNGTLDFVLTKPIDSQFYVTFRQMLVWRAVDTVLGLGLAVAGAVAMARSVPPLHVVYFLLMLAAGAVVIYSFWLILATSVFWFTRIDNIEMVFWNVFEAGRYPIDIYRPWVRWTLTFLIPLAFLTTFPAAALVGKATPYGLLAGAVVAPAMLLLASWFWRFGLRRYSGASA